MAMKKGTEMLAFAAIVIVAISFLPGTNVPVLSGIFSTGGGVDGEPAVTTVNVVGDKACGSTTMTVDFQQKYSASTDVTAQNATVHINGGKKGVFSEGSTFTAQGGDILDVYYALDPAQTTYYAAHANGEIPCTGQTAAFLTSGSYQGVKILDAGDLAGPLQKPIDAVYRADTAAGMSVTIINDDNSLNSQGGTGSNQSVGAGETVSVEVRLKPTFERGYGVARGNSLMCQFNDTAWDQSGSVVSLNGVNLGAAEFVPTNTLFPLADTSRTVKGWKVPAIDGKDSSRLDFVFTVKGDDTNQPFGAESGAGPNWNCTLFDTDLYEDDDGNIKVDVEDRDDNTNIGVTDFAFAIGFD